MCERDVMMRCCDESGINLVTESGSRSRLLHFYESWDDDAQRDQQSEQPAYLSPPSVPQTIFISFGGEVAKFYADVKWLINCRVCVTCYI